LLLLQPGRLGAQTCPNRCSGHGTCLGGAQLLCQCAEGFQGPDCSLRGCPSAPAWAGASRLSDDVHSRLAECSAAGTCDRARGACVCSAGFEGAACEKMSCGGGAAAACQRNGRCISLRQAAQGYDGYRLVHAPSAYDEWDADRVRGCLCDFGFAGASCTLRQCPAGDDPATPGAPEVQELSCQCASTTGVGCAPGGFWTVAFAGRTARVRATAVASRADEAADMPRGSGAAPGESLQAILESLRPSAPTFASVQYAAAARAAAAGDAAGAGALVGACDSAGENAIRVTFLRSAGDVPQLQVSAGTLTDVSGAPATVSAATLQQASTERLPCSNQGECNVGDGQCSCYPGRYASDGNGGPGSIPDCGSFVAPAQDASLLNTSAAAAAAATLAANLAVSACPAPTCNDRGTCVVEASSAEAVAYVADAGNNRVRAVSPVGLVTSFAGSGFGLAGHADGQGTSALFTEPFAVDVDAGGNVIVLERAGCYLRRITPTGLVTTLSGSGAVDGADGAAGVASFRFPRGVAVDRARAGTIYVADTGMHAIRAVDPATGAVRTLAGGMKSPEAFIPLAGGAFLAAWNVSRNCSNCSNSSFFPATQFLAGSEDGVGRKARFFNPTAVAVDQATGLVYVSDTGNALIRVVDPATGNVTTLAGSRAGGGSADGVGTAATFFNPRGLVVVRDFMRSAAANARALFVADGSGVLRRVDLATRVVTTVAGSAVDDWGDPSAGLLVNSGDAGMQPSAASLPAFSQDLGAVAAVEAGAAGGAGAGGYALVADEACNCVRRVSPAGVVTTLAGGLSAAAAAAMLAQAARDGVSLAPTALFQATAGHVDGVGTSARFNRPQGVALAVRTGPQVARCRCFAGYSGPTCLAIACPTGRAWFDEPSGPHEAHAEAECSGAGDCDPGSGTCACLPGFYGAACERALCPTADPARTCSGHGRCLSMRELAAAGRFGGAPLGALEVQELQCTLTAGSFTVSARNARSPRLPFSASVSSLEQALEDIPGVGFVTVRASPPGAQRFCAPAADARGARGTRLRVTFETQFGDVAPLQFRVFEPGGAGQGVTVAEVARGGRTSYGDDPFSAATWDADMMYGCLCDQAGDMNHTDAEHGDRGAWSGPACDQRTCPVGSDKLAPLPGGATHPSPEVQSLRCGAATGSFLLIFRGRATPPILASDGAAAVKAKLEAAESIGVVDVATDPPGAAVCAEDARAVATTTRVTFRTELGDLPLLAADTFLLDFAVDAGGAPGSGGGAIEVREEAAGVAAVADCAGRGICSVAQGTCACFPAWYSSDGFNNMGRRGDCGVYDLASYGSLSQQ
jgi:hypothetical protein